jgi:hypothetical protein
VELILFVDTEEPKGARKQNHVVSHRTNTRKSGHVRPRLKRLFPRSAYKHVSSQFCCSRLPEHPHISALLNLHTMSAALTRRIARASASRLIAPRVLVIPKLFGRGASDAGVIRISRRCLHCTRPSREAASATAIRKELSKAEKESYKGENISYRIQCCPP